MTSAHSTTDSSTALSHGMSVARMVMIFGLAIHHLFQLPNAGADPYQGLQGYQFLPAEALSAFFHLAFMCAVPVLSVISGYLLFKKPNLSYLKVMEKKAKTVALPSLLWCTLWLGFGFCLYSVGKPFGWFEWANYDFDHFTMSTLANGLFGLYLYDPFAYQFWFIHDLILTLLIFPVLQLGLRYLPDVFISVAFIGWILGFVPPGFFSFNVTFFFMLGGFLVLCPQEHIAQIFQQRSFSLGVVAFFTLFLTLRAWTFWIFNEELHGHWVVGLIRSDTYLLALRAVGVVAAVQMLVWLYRYAKGAFYFIHRFSGYSFFVFAAHYPIIELYKIIVERIPGQASNTGLILTWLCVPLITVLTCIVMAVLCDKWFPKLFQLLNGGRLLAASTTVQTVPTPQVPTTPNFPDDREQRDLAA